MGASDSKLVFKQGIFKLAEPLPIPVNEYWAGVNESFYTRKYLADFEQFWSLPESTEDVFSLFTPVDVRRVRDSSLANLEALISALTSRLYELRHHLSFPDAELAPEKHALNCIRVLTRILPFIYEADQLETWEEKVFWTPRRRRLRKEQAAKSEILFDQTRTQEDSEPLLKEQFEDIRPLGEELIDTLTDLLFFTGFTLPHTERLKNKVTYSIWQSGVGCNTPMSSSKELESNRTEILRLLLTLASKSLYMPARMFLDKNSHIDTNQTRHSSGERGKISHVHCDLPGQATGSVIALFAAEYCRCQLKPNSWNSNTMQTLKYNPASWRVPYDYVVYKDPKQILVTYCLQFLLVLVSYPIPQADRGPPLKNYFQHFLGRLHRPQDFQFLVDGMMRTLNQPVSPWSFIVSNII